MLLPSERQLEDFKDDKFGYNELSKNILDNVLLEMQLPNSFGL